MLVLTRKIDQAIVIGDMIEVKVLGISGNKVKLGIMGDREIPIVRGELLSEAIGAPVSELWIDSTEQPNCELALV